MNAQQASGLLQSLSKKVLATEDTAQRLAENGDCPQGSKLASTQRVNMSSVRSLKVTNDSLPQEIMLGLASRARLKRKSLVERLQIAEKPLLKLASGDNLHRTSRH